MMSVFFMTATPCAKSAGTRSSWFAIHVDEIVLVDTDAICAAIKEFPDTRSILEPAGALQLPV